MSLLELGPTIFGPTAGIIAYFRAKGLLATSEQCSRYVVLLLNIVYAYMYTVDAATKCMNVRDSRLAQMVCAGGVDPAKQRNQYVLIVFSPSQS